MDAVVPPPSRPRPGRAALVALTTLITFAVLLITAATSRASDDLFVTLSNPTNPFTGAVQRTLQTAPGGSQAQTVQTMDDPADTTGYNPVGIAVTATHVYTAVRITHQSNPTYGAVSRVGIDGSSPTLSLFTPCTATTPATELDTSTLATNGQHVYYICRGTSFGPSRFIGRASLDGTTVDDAFMNISAGPWPNLRRIAVSATHVYATTMALNKQLVRAALDPSAAPEIANMAEKPNGVAVAGPHVYWQWENSTSNTTGVGRANLDLTGEVSSLVSGGFGEISSLAVSDAYIFWKAPGTRTIGRANLDGSDKRADFGGLPGPGDVSQLAVKLSSATPTPATHELTVAKAGTGAGTVASSPAGIDCGATCKGSFAGGTSVTLTATAAAGSSFAGWSGACTGTSASCTVAVGAAATATATFTATKAVVKGKPAYRAGSATLTVEAPAAGTLALVGTRTSGRSAGAKVAPVCKATRKVAKAGRVKITCSPNGATRRLLRKGRVRVSVTLTFTTVDGTTATTRSTLTLPHRR